MGGKDKLTGSKKNDILDGGDGNDVLNGKRGADVYVLSSGKDKFKGFKLKEGDTIQIDSDITYSLVQSKKNTLINHDDGGESRQPGRGAMTEEVAFAAKALDIEMELEWLQFDNYVLLDALLPTWLGSGPQ